MADFETHDEKEAVNAAWCAWMDDDKSDGRNEPGAFKRGWLASREYHRQVSEREIAESAARLQEKRGG